MGPMVSRFFDSQETCEVSYIHLPTNNRSTHECALIDIEVFGIEAYQLLDFQFAYFFCERRLVNRAVTTLIER